MKMNRTATISIWHKEDLSLTGQVFWRGVRYSSPITGKTEQDIQKIQDDCVHWLENHPEYSGYKVEVWRIFPYQAVNRTQEKS